MHKFSFHLIPRETEYNIRKIPTYVFRAVLMDMLSKIDAKYIEMLHTPNQIRPYAISIQKDDLKICFNLVILKEELSKAILDFIISTADFKMNINDIEHVLLKIDLETIKMESIIKHARKISKFRLRFLTPTYFNISGRDFVMRFPEPTFIIENLAHIWNTFAPIACKVDFTELYKWVSQNVFASSYNLKTKSFNIGKKTPVVGCVGWANYIIKNPEKKYSSWLDILLNFAMYSNIGGNRTAACGVMNYKPMEILNQS